MKTRARKASPSDDYSHEVFPTRSLTDPAVIRTFAIDAARLLADNKCTDVVVLHVAGLSQLADYLVICTGSSDRQMRSTADDIAELAESLHYPVFGRNDDDRATWIVLDCVDVVVHIFEPNTRAHYDLEMLWGDAPRVDFARAADEGGKRARAGTKRPARKA